MHNMCEDIPNLHYRCHHHKLSKEVSDEVSPLDAPQELI